MVQYAFPAGKVETGGHSFLVVAELAGWSILVLAAGFAGWVDAIAGGGGLLTVPALLAWGLPPHVALGTNKLQAACGSGSATWRFRHAGWVRLQDCLPGSLVACTTGALGSLAVQSVADRSLRHWIPLFLLAATFIVALRRNFAALRRHARFPVGKMEPLAAILLGFYDGFFGPGTGTLWTMVLVSWGGLELTVATARTKIMNFASNLGSLVVFAGCGMVSWKLGLAMGVAQAVGARLGARMAVTRGRPLIRTVYLSVVAALILRLLWDAWDKMPAHNEASSPSTDPESLGIEP
ncbi:MAG: TSUP family transporter [Verrucomicrobiota bacterium]|nr:TSUP family transporter [Limisphaera sp.]MDW8381681.1 TSUP family transporter [Verrucomicrobiota bacterium]